MQIFLKNLDGKSTILFVHPYNTVATLKAKVLECESIPVNLQLLMHCGKVLEDEWTLQDYHIQQDSNIQLKLRFYVRITEPQKKIKMLSDGPAHRQTEEEGGPVKKPRLDDGLERGQLKMKVLDLKAELSWQKYLNSVKDNHIEELKESQRKQKKKIKSQLKLIELLVNQL